MHYICSFNLKFKILLDDLANTLLRVIAIVVKDKEASTMAYWIFQGNPKVFNVSTYLIDNEFVTWDVRQKQYIDEIKTGDLAFIWRSDGGKKNTGGIIGLCEVVSEPYYVSDKDKNEVKLRVLEYRVSPDQGMLLRHELKEIPEAMNLQIFKMSQGTNYKLDSEEYERLYKLWNGLTTSTIKSVTVHGV